MDYVLMVLLRKVLLAEKMRIGSNTAKKGVELAVFPLKTKIE